MKSAFIVLLITFGAFAHAQKKMPNDVALMQSIQRLDANKISDLMASKDIVLKGNGTPPGAQQMPVNPVIPTACTGCSYGGNVQIWVTKAGREKIIDAAK